MRLLFNINKFNLYRWEPYFCIRKIYKNMIQLLYFLNFIKVNMENKVKNINWGE